MIDVTRTMRYALATLILVAAVCIDGARQTAQAQDKAQSTVPSVKQLSVGRDPFRKYEAPRVITKKAGQLMTPSIVERIAQYKAQKQAAMSARLPAPKPTTALLLSEIQVIGISRTPRGYAAIVEAMPIKLSYVIYPGEKFYDGQLVAVEDNRLVFRHETVFADGRRERTVDIKPLRQPTPVEQMGLQKQKSAPTTTTSVVEAEKQKPATTEKP
jgi:hypothetical protein